MNIKLRKLKSKNLMNLVIDIGNTRTKIALFKTGKIVKKSIFETEELVMYVKDYLRAYPETSRAIIASVDILNKEDLKVLQETLPVMVLSHNTSVPFINLYATPDTLGIDRIALISASINSYPNTNTLIIDAGTCITYDFVSNKNEYYGGAISPGLSMRFKALHEFTAKLPLLEPQMPVSITGNTTASSIQSGVIIGIINEISGVILEYEKKHEVLTVILTGGDAKFLSKQLKNSIFANSNFLLEGLNFILEFNSIE